jgi:hypothetical protein
MKSEFDWGQLAILLLYAVLAYGPVICLTYAAGEGNFFRVLFGRTGKRRRPKKKNRPVRA